MTTFGYAPTQDIPRTSVTRTPTTAVPSLRTVTAPAPAVPGSIRPGTLVGYFGSRLKDHGDWVCDGRCGCGCGGMKLWRYRPDGLHRLVHVSAASLTTWGAR